MNRTVIYEKFGGPEVLEIRDTPEPHPQAGQVRVRVTAVGLNPMDWIFSSMPQMAQQFGITLPSGFGTDFAGTIDETGPDVTAFTIGDRVYGGAVGRAATDHLIVDPTGTDTLEHTPAGLTDDTACTLPVAGATAAAALAAIDLRAGDTVLIGGAAGGVGVFAVQLARAAGARVIGTAAPSTFDFLRDLGAEPVPYGPGLADRVRALAPDGLTAATDLHGTETAEAALALGVAPQRISTIAAGPNPPGGVRATGGANALPGDLKRIAEAVAAGDLTVPIEARFPIEKIQDAVRTQAERHTHGKIIVTL
ncbi:NADPH:quinone reductase-like Zn-dependent oxidoreductase [Catenulispora sp. GAS73]|uniref:NADP-dependent oxidoreductase n=1 Tax=Catenulispora sp. GAS73 TaxID=3156269 RepID=UPI003512156A